MNGRVYDYNLGRFLSVDPFIQAPTSTQSINPYSYIMNNPMAGTDPTGYCSTDDTMKDCTDGLEEGKTQTITDKDGKTVGHIGKDSNGDVHISNGSNSGQKAVTNIIASVGKPSGTSGDSSGENILNIDYEKLKPTDKEYELVKDGKLSEMWKGRCSNSDPIGCVGFATWGTVDEIRDYYGDNKLEAEYWIGVGSTVQFNATTGLLQGNEFMQSEIGRTYLPHFTKEFGKKIALAHLRATERDFKNTPYFLSASQITEYHHRVFDAHNVSRKWYGGSYMTGKHERILTPTYCRPTCDIE